MGKRHEAIGIKQPIRFECRAIYRQSGYPTMIVIPLVTARTTIVLPGREYHQYEQGTHVHPSRHPARRQYSHRRPACVDVAAGLEPPIMVSGAAKRRDARRGRHGLTEIPRYLTAASTPRRRYVSCLCLSAT